MFSSGTVSFVSKLLCADTGRGCRLQLQRWVRRKREFVVNPPPIEQPEVDPREAARAELGELTGGMSFEELRSIIEPKASNIKELMSSETISSPTTSELTIGRRNEDLTPARLSSEASLPPTYNLAAYVEKCDPDSTLYRLLALGVNLHNIEKRKGLAQYVLGLRFEEDVQKHLWWLRDQQIPANMLGKWLTKNPLIFKVDLDDLQTRVNYLESKKFTPTQIQRILNNNPFWLMFSTRRIDRRLGFFQKEFQLRGDDVRFLASKQPNLITYNLEHIRKSTFVIREEMGFEKDEVTALLLNKPRLWMQNSDHLIERFSYIHEQMNLSHSHILQVPEILTLREFQLRDRHEFLEMLGKAQYDPRKDLYISPKALAEGNIYYFVREVAKSNIETYNLFLKTR